jgi:chorismate-pyruvate lyase
VSFAGAIQNGSGVIVFPFAHPLDDFYAKAGLPLPRIEPLPGPSVPEPYRQLLVHEGDMTPKLEAFYQSAIHLNVIHRELRENFYFREVVLLTDSQDTPVEFGAIKMFLSLFPSSARNDILAERLPLGTILAKHKIPHFSRPKAFLKIEADEFIKKALKADHLQLLYGRRNTLSNGEQHPLAEIVEILAPTERKL